MKARRAIADMALAMMALAMMASSPELRADAAASPDSRGTGAGRGAMGEGYRLVWSDEFEGSGRPDPSKWGYETGFARNHEDQWYDPANAFLEGGKLVIEARREDRESPAYVAGSSDWRTSRSRIAYSSASLMTKGLAQWKYGRIEVRARLDVDKGLWPAIWTLGVEGEWPSCGELDIMEMYPAKGIPSVLANAAWGCEERWTAVWNSVVTPLSSLSSSLEDWSSSFHVWRADWDEDRIAIYLDDRLLNEIELSRALNPDGKCPFRQPHYLILNLAVGGDNGGDPSATAFPRRYEVDYVRVYERQR